MSFNNGQQQPLLSLSCNNLDRQVVESNDLGTMWTAFHKCKSYIEQGQRLEYMSWRLWHQQKKNRIDNNIKQMITSLLLSPATTFIHDAYSHEVPQSPQKCYKSTIHYHASNNNNNNKQPSATTTTTTSFSLEEQLQETKDSATMNNNEDNTSFLSRSSSFCKVILEDTNQDDIKEAQAPGEKHIPVNDHLTTLDNKKDDCNDDDDYVEDEDDDDYYLSDEDEIYDDEEEVDDDINYHFVKDFQKTQPRPATPRRSLLSDLLQRVSSPPSLLSNSSSSFTSNSTTTHHSSSMIMEEDYTLSTTNINKHSSSSSLSAFNNNNTTKTPIQLTCIKSNNNKLNTILPPNDSTNSEPTSAAAATAAKWRESFHGW